MSEKKASCVLLWIHQGGKIVNGKPVRVNGVNASGLCDEPTDCFTCPLMQREMAFHPPGHAIWICPDCYSSAISVAKAKGITHQLAGHYTEGQCQFVGCVRPPRIEYDEEMENLVEKPRGYSRLLQLFIGDVNT